MVDDSSSLFAVFFLALYTLVLLPYTIYKVCSATSASGETVKPWLKAQRSSSLSKFVRRFMQPSNFILLGLWAVFVLLVFYIKATAQDAQPFDPFGILQLQPGATDKEIKRAYRQMSLRYHPDKNPDPAAGKYFAEFVVKAYKALSDPIARKNFAEHGHPDGPQSITMGIALPEWLLDSQSKSAPMVLAGLVFGGILLPLVAAACYLMSANKFVGPNGIMEETFDYFLRSQVGVREAQSLGRIPETLTVAMEFITMPTLQEQLPAMEELRKQTLRLHPELRDKKNFWARKASCLKAHMLLLAHLSRDDIPPILEKDSVYVMRKSPQLLEEIIKIAVMARPPRGNGWLAPTMGAIEFLQHLTQAVPLAARRNPGALKGAVEGAAPMLQLPHMDAEVLRKLSRKKLRSLQELQQAEPAERREALLAAGLTDGQLAQLETSLASIPSVSVTASCLVDGELSADVFQGDAVTCRAHVLLSRPSHATAGFSGEGSGVLAFAPHYPVPREEMWFFLLADPTDNAVLGLTRVSLLEAEYLQAEAEAASRAAAAADGPAGTAAGKALVVGSAKAAGQVVDIKFSAHAVGRRELALYCMSDCWLAADCMLPIRVKVQELSRAEKEGRAVRGKRVISLDEEGNPEEEVDMQYTDEERDEGDEQDEEDEDDDWDSEDSGSDESGFETDEPVAAGGARRRPSAAVVIEEEDGDSSDDENVAEGVVPAVATLLGKKA